MKSILIAMLIAVLGGCASNQKIIAPPLYKDTSIESVKTLIRLPELNSRSKSEVGENLYTKFYHTPANTYSVLLDQDVVVSVEKERQYWWLALGIVGAGIMELSADESENKISNRESIPLYYWPELGSKMICGNNNECLIDRDGLSSFTHKAEYPDKKLTILDSVIPYQMNINPPRFDKEDFKYEVLYQGKIGNKIKISYREFKNDMARPAFTQDIEYELKEAGITTIGFKGLRIDVYNATNLSIEYEIVQDYK
jgi:hypothetical protein